ncbi:MAG: hypothetical protein ABR875_04300 [Minisyncoccia bacterium]|jgi:hypothetical protein
MTSKAQEDVVKRKDVIDYSVIIEKYPWLIQKNQNCVLSPDSDGLLCGLFVSHFLNWKIRGFYDGKVLLLEDGFKVSDCIFLDMEIYRNKVRSIGQHMVLFNKNQLPNNWKNFDNCFSANNVRGYDAKHNFPQKYPLATIHLLLGVLGSVQRINLSLSAICPLLYTDGTFKNLFNYPDNCLSWLGFLKADRKTSPLHTIFFSDHYSISSLMIALNELFGELRTITGGKRGGDKIKISDGKGELINFDDKKKSFKIDAVEQIEKFLKLLVEDTGWNYKSTDWSWGNLSFFEFKKEIIKPSQGRYNELIAKNPVSLAMTSTLVIEYTLDPNNVF